MAEVAILIGLQASGKTTFCHQVLATHDHVSKDAFSCCQSDATRCALNCWCYWTLRKAGASRRQATHRLEGTTTADKNELLYGHGVNVNDLPAWQRRGIGLWWEAREHAGHGPIRGVDVTTTRRAVRIERRLPMKDGYRALVDRLTTGERV